MAQRAPRWVDGVGLASHRDQEAPEGRGPLAKGARVPDAHDLTTAGWVVTATHWGGKLKAHGVHLPLLVAQDFPVYVVLCASAGKDGCCYTLTTAIYLSS
jgi:hypothetical protein